MDDMYVTDEALQTTVKAKQQGKDLKMGSKGEGLTHGGK